VTESELRAKIRELMASGVLPGAPPVIERAGATAQNGKARPEPCTICEEPDPQISYFWPGGVMIRVHATCRALWHQERAR
jgi:hypothetical protein